MPTQFVPQTFTGLRELLSTEYGADAYTPASDSPGSTLDPVFNALALLAIQIQQQLSIPLSLAARLATSTGADTRRTARSIALWLSGDFMFALSTKNGTARRTTTIAASR